MCLDPCLRNDKGIIQTLHYVVELEINNTGKQSATQTCSGSYELCGSSGDYLKLLKVWHQIKNSAASKGFFSHSFQIYIYVLHSWSTNEQEIRHVFDFSINAVALDFKLRSLKCTRDSDLFRKVNMSHIKCGVLLTNWFGSGFGEN